MGSSQMKSKTEEIEFQLLLEVLDQYYGYDLKNYATASLLRRIKMFVTAHNFINMSLVQKDSLKMTVSTSLGVFPLRHWIINSLHPLIIYFLLNLGTSNPPNL